MSARCGMPLFAGADALQGKGSGCVRPVRDSGAESARGTVSAGMSGEEVVEVQDCLVQMGYLDEVTGVYDDATVAAVKAFQSANGLTPDGKCGERTLLILFGY